MSSTTILSPFAYHTISGYLSLSHLTFSLYIYRCSISFLRFLPSFFFNFSLFSGPVPLSSHPLFLQPRPKRSRIFFFFFLFFLLLLLLLQRYLTTQRELVNILEVGRNVMQAVRGASLLPQEARLSLLVGVHVVRGTRLHLGAWSYREFLWLNCGELWTESVQVDVTSPGRGFHASVLLIGSCWSKSKLEFIFWIIQFIIIC